MSLVDVLSGARQWWVECEDARRSRLPDASVHCAITSPPYWGLRDYGIPASEWADGWVGCLGSEATPDQFVAHLCEVFDEVWRVLRNDGVLWVNIGDSYVVQEPGNGRGEVVDGAKPHRGTTSKRNCGLRRKNLALVPARFSLAMQARGWYVRCDGIWHKTACLPDGAKDRPTRNHEYLFLFTKRDRYFYDQEAALEPYATWDHSSRYANEYDLRDGGGQPGNTNNTGIHSRPGNPNGKNRRSVWSIAPSPFKGPHFATFPPDLVEPCILLGTSAKGCCATCGAPWRRLTEVGYRNPGNRTTNGPRSVANRAITPGFPVRLERVSETTGWQPTCKHVGEPVPCLVYDCFAGAGTTILTAIRHGRRAVGTEIGKQNVLLTADRVFRDAPLFTEPMPEAAG